MDSDVRLKCHETTNVPMVKYNFVELSGLEALAKDAICGTCRGPFSIRELF